MRITMMPFLLLCLTACGQKGALYLPETHPVPTLAEHQARESASRQPPARNNPGRE